MSDILKFEVAKAIKIVDSFLHIEPQEPLTLTKDATYEELWDRILILERKKVKKPKVEAVVRLLLEDPELIHISLRDLAKIIQEVYAKYGLTCRTSEKSLSWYCSQRSNWDIQRRSGLLQQEE